MKDRQPRYRYIPALTTALVWKDKLWGGFAHGYANSLAGRGYYGDAGYWKNLGDQAFTRARARGDTVRRHEERVDAKRRRRLN